MVEAGRVDQIDIRPADATLNHPLPDVAARLRRIPVTSRSLSMTGLRAGTESRFASGLKPKRPPRFPGEAAGVWFR